MLLAIDIGNTTISIGALKLKEGKIERIETVETNQSAIKLKKNLARIFHALKNKYLFMDSAMICSVAPWATEIVESLLKTQFKIKPIIIGRNVHVPIQNNYHYPQQVGQDRLVVAYAAKYFYGAPVLVIDFGTAITFDVVSAKGAYEGGIIVPGIRLSAESLFQKTALLPRLEKFQIPKNLIGKTTQESILSGLFYGYGVLSKGLIAAISKKMKKRPKVIITGGHAHLMKKLIGRYVTRMDPHLIFQGMKLIYDKMD